MIKTKLITTLGAVGTVSVLAIPFTTISCGSEVTKDNFKVSIAAEKSWVPIINKALDADLTNKERARIEIVELENGESVKYLDTIGNSAATAADLFVAPGDRFAGLVKSSILQDLGTVEGYELQIGSIDSKTYAYPLNVESVIQFYNLDAFTTKKGKVNGWDTYEKAIAAASVDGTNDFIAQLGNFWHASPIVNTAIEVHGKKESPAKYNTITTIPGGYAEGKGKSSIAPFLANDAFGTGVKTSIKAIWDYNNALRNNVKAKWANVANNVGRDAVIRDGLAKGTIGSTIEGPWIVSDLLARILDRFKDDKAGGVKFLEKMRAAKLPTWAGSQGRHFSGGWGYAINKAKLAEIDQDVRATKLTLEKKVLASITSKKYATNWYQDGGGKLSAATGAKIEINADTIKNSKIDNPATVEKDDKINLSDWAQTKGFTDALAAFYTSIKDAVATQSAFNVAQPSHTNYGKIFEAWDKNGISSASLTTFEEFYEKFKTSFERSLKEKG